MWTFTSILSIHITAKGTKNCMAVRLDTPSNVIFNLNLKFEQFRQKDHLSHITVAKDLESC